MARRDLTLAGLLCAALGFAAAPPPSAPPRAAGALPEAARLLPAGSSFLIGLDVGRFVKSALYARLVEQARQKSGSDLDPLEELRQKTGLDPARDLDQLVIAGESGPGDPAVAVVTGHFDAARLGSFFKQRPDVTVHTFGKYTLYLSQSSVTGRGDTAAVVMDPGRLLIGERGKVERVLTGKTPGLAADGVLSGLTARVRPGATLWLVGDERLTAGLPGGPGSAPGGLNLPPLKSLVVSADFEPQVSMDLEGDTGDPQSARTLADALRGLNAMLAMQSANKPELAQLSQALTIGEAEGRVKLELRVPYELIEKLTKSMSPPAPAATPASPAAPAPQP